MLYRPSLRHLRSPGKSPLNAGVPRSAIDVRCKRACVHESATSPDQFLAERRVLGGGVLGRHNVVRAVAHARDRQRFDRNRLCLGGLFFRNLAGRNRDFFDAEDGFSCHPIEDVHVPGLGCERENRNGLTVDGDVEKARW